MTTRWAPSPIWKGETVAVLATGPRMSEEIAQSYRRHRVIVVNDAARVAQWADMLVAFDLGHPANRHLEDFAGMRVCAHESELDALCMGQLCELVEVEPGRHAVILNSGLGAVRIAAAMGAARIILAGFEPEVPRHFYDDEVDTGEYVGVRFGLTKIVKELRAKGVTVEFDPRSATEPGLSTAQPSGSPSIS